MKNVIHWLYRGSEPLTAVMLPENATPDQVRVKAMQSHSDVPLQPCGYTPYEWGHMLRFATVQR